jgi:hypothetical protein
MKHVSSAALSLTLLAFAISGCGGSGAISGAENKSIRDEVVSAVKGGFSSQSTGASANSGGRTIRSALPPSRQASELLYDGFYELYFRISGNEDATMLRFDYFVDQEATQPAGFVEKRSINETDSQALLEITKGKYAGKRQTSSSRYAPPELTFSFEGSEADGSMQTGKGVYVIGTDEFSGEFNSVTVDQQGVSRSFRVIYATDRTSRVTYDSPSLFQYTLDFRADRSGTGTVTGNNAQLPAAISWDSDGNGSIVFADGVKVEFAGFDFNQI